MWQHGEFSVLTKPTIHTLCEELSYKSTFNESEITRDSDPPVQYDETSFTWTIASNDFGLVAQRLIYQPYDFTITAYFKNYPSVEATSGLSETIDIYNPCASVPTFKTAESYSLNPYNYYTEAEPFAVAEF